MPEDTNKVLTLIELSSNYYGVDPSAAIANAENARNLSIQLGFKKAEPSH